MSSPFWPHEAHPFSPRRGGEFTRSRRARRPAPAQEPGLGGGWYCQGSPPAASVSPSAGGFCGFRLAPAPWEWFRFLTRSRPHLRTPTARTAPMTTATWICNFSRALEATASSSLEGGRQPPRAAAGHARPQTVIAPRTRSRWRFDFIVGPSSERMAAAARWKRPGRVMARACYRSLARSGRPGKTLCSGLPSPTLSGTRGLSGRLSSTGPGASASTAR
jgi:hypothetical protein